jgi:rubrerythrin
MSKTIEQLIADFADEMQQVIQRYSRFAEQAEETGFTQLAKFFRAIVASETRRSRLILPGLAAHAGDNVDVFVCPHCGLIYMPEPPEKCPVDQTPGAQFEKID